MARKPAKVGIAPILALIVLAAIPAVGFGYLWHWADARVPAPEVAEIPVAPNLPIPLTTPVLSVRRAPRTLASLSSDGSLVTALTALGTLVNDTSCMVVEVDGRKIYDHGGDAPVTPASNEKLITGAVALEVLGPDFTYTTKLLGNVVNGVVQGDLFMLGGGDPLLSTADYPPSIITDAPTNVTPLENLVTALVTAGITQVQGRVVGDDSRYDTQRFIPSWSDSIKNGEAGPLGALMVNDSTRQIGSTKRYTDPAAGAATDLTRLLKAAGIKVSGAPAVGPTPADLPVVASVQSATMANIVGEMLTTSDDNTAEMLLKEISVHADNVIGSTLDGIDVIKRVLTEWGIDTTKISLVDGSGLDSGNVVTCNILLQVLLHQPLDGPLGAGLAVAGQTGTLATQFVDSTVVGRLHAKTGTLTNVKALTGYVTTTGGTLDFSLVLGAPGISDESKGPGTGPYEAFWNELAKTLGAYPSGPTVDILAPR
ncbi:MAG: dac [Ilumatobacteraceae bacterium]|nr:dac [Ilumatobacteraceae bacterium]